jgi:hypothetical protein
MGEGDTMEARWSIKQYSTERDRESITAAQRRGREREREEREREAVLQRWRA